MTRTSLLLGASALALAGCIFQPTVRERFLTLLHEHRAAHPDPGPAALAPEQEARRQRILELRKEHPEDFAQATLAVEGFEDTDPDRRYRALHLLAGAGPCGEEVFRFRAGFFDPLSPSDFDAFLVKTDDPALFHLRKDVLLAEGDRAAAAARALDLILDVKTACLLALLPRKERPFESPLFHEILAAGDRACPVLRGALGDAALAPYAFEALRTMGSETCAEILADLLAGAAREGDRERTVLGALESMPPGSVVPAIGRLLRESAMPDPLPASWLVARRATPAQRDIAAAVAASADPDIALAGQCGLLRLGDPGAAGEIRDRALREGAAAAPLPVLDFLGLHPHLVRFFPEEVSRLACDGPLPVRARAASLLAQLSGDAAARVTRKACGDPAPEVRLAAVAAAGRRLRAGRVDFLVQALLERLDDADPAVRRTAADALGLARDPRAVDPLLKRLDGPDAEDARAALRALALYRSPAVLARIPLRCYWGGDEELRRQMVRALVLAADPSAVACLNALLELPDGPTKLFALSLLTPADAEPFLPALLGFLESSDPVLKGETLVFLARMGCTHRSADPARYAADPDPRLRGGAIEALGLCGGALDKLLGISESPDPFTRARALAALALAPRPDAAPRMEAALLEGPQSGRILACRALGRIRSAPSIPFLVRGAADPWPQVRLEAARALAGMEPGQTGPVLKGLLADPDPAVRAAAHAALGSSGAPELGMPLEAMAPLERARILELLGSHREAAEAHREAFALHEGPFGSCLAAARCLAAAGDADGVLELLARARDLGFEDFARLAAEDDRAPLFEDEGFAGRVRGLFRPAPRGEGFLARFRGRARIHFQNGSHLEGEIMGFRNERFILRLPTGLSEISKGQVVRVETLE